jgi:hypothetical protein
MGWVSMREDQIERASEQLKRVRAQTADLVQTPRQEELLDLLLSDVAAVIEEARQLVELATDPQVDLARRALDLEDQVQEMKAVNEQRSQQLAEANRALEAGEREAKRLLNSLLNYRPVADPWIGLPPAERGPSIIGRPAR